MSIAAPIAAALGVVCRWFAVVVMAVVMAVLVLFMVPLLY
jgi:hypothetical protein